MLFLLLFLTQHETAAFNNKSLPLPIQSQALSTRPDLFLTANYSNLTSIKTKVPQNLWLLLSAIRLMAIEGSLRPDPGPKRSYMTLDEINKDESPFKRENWTRREIEVFLKVGLCCFSLNQRMKQDKSFQVRDYMERISIEEKGLLLYHSTRSINLNPTIQFILETEAYLSQALLIDEELGRPQYFMNGKLLMLELFRLEKEDQIMTAPVSSPSYSSWRFGATASSQGSKFSNPIISKFFLPEVRFSSKDEKFVGDYLEIVLEGLEDILGVDVAEQKRIANVEMEKVAKDQAYQASSQSVDSVSKSTSVGEGQRGAANVRVIGRDRWRGRGMRFVGVLDGKKQMSRFLSLTCNRYLIPIYLWGGKRLNWGSGHRKMVG